MTKKGLYLLKTVTPSLIAIALAGGFGGKYIVETIGGYIIENQKNEDLKDEVISEIETIDPNSDEPIVIKSSTDDSKVTNSSAYVKDDEPKDDESKVNKEDSEDKVIEEENQVEIHTDLIDSGYEFKQVNFKKLKKINEDICGWLTIDGTPIDYPVLMSSDDVFYLEHGYDKTPAQQGSIFVDYYNSSLDSDYNELSDITVIHGHHQADGSMFDSVANFDNQSFYDDRQFAVIYTPDGYAYKATFIAGVVCEYTDSHLLYRGFENEKDFNKYIKSIKKMSTFETDETVEYGDKIVVFNTCYYTSINDSTHRFLLFARLDKELIKQKEKTKVKR